MSSKFRIFTRCFLVFANIVLAFIFLLACLAPYLNPRTWWFVSLLGLAFPFLLLFIILFLVGWLFVKKKWALISALSLLLGAKSIGVFFAFHVSGGFSNTKPEGSFRVVTWNVARFIELAKNNNEGSHTRLHMLELLQQQNADVLCLQEFHSAVLPGFYNNIYAVQKLGYPYYYFSFDPDGPGHYNSSVIFSKHPIIDTQIVRYPRPTLREVLLRADIRVNEDTISFYTTHLQSLQFRKEDYDKIDEIKGGNDSIIANSRTIVSKLKRGFVNRSIQANIIEETMEQKIHPSVFCADLNDIPNSYTYATVRGDMQDAFLKKGFGIGRTFSALSPTLRIDYIFADDNFNILQFDRNLKRYSDHYMLVADITLKK